MESKLNEQDHVNYLLHQAMEQKVPVSIALVDPLEELRVIGIIESISEQYGKFKVNDDWFPMEDIEGIELMNIQHEKTSS